MVIVFDFLRVGSATDGPSDCVSGASAGRGNAVDFAPFSSNVAHDPVVLTGEEESEISSVGMDEVEVSRFERRSIFAGLIRGLLFLDVGPCKGVVVRASQTPSIGEPSLSALTPNGRSVLTRTGSEISPLSATSSANLRSRRNSLLQFMILTVAATKITIRSNPPSTYSMSAVIDLSKETLVRRTKLSCAQLDHERNRIPATAMTEGSDNGRWLLEW